MIQAADVLSGAVAWVWNKRYEKDASHHKRTLAAHVAMRAKLQPTKAAKTAGMKRGDVLTLGFQTLPHQEEGFAIWSMDFLKGKQHRN